MKAMILCAGYGTRLGDLTRDTPKPMLRLHGKPLLEWLIVHLVSQGIRDIAVNLHFMPETIASYFGDGGHWGGRLRYFQEETLLGTAGGVKNMSSFIGNDEPFLVQYGDILTDQDFVALGSAHLKSGALATLLLHERKRSNSVVVMDGKNRITGLLERPTDEERKGVLSSWVNSAVAIFSPGIFAHIPIDTVCDLPRDIYPKLIPGGLVYGFPLSGYRCAIDSPERLESAKQALESGECRIGAASGKAADFSDHR